jgi:hypothetical protein
MPQFNLKVPIINYKNKDLNKQSQLYQGIFPTETRVLESNDISKGVGSFVTILYFIFIIYIYTAATLNKEKGISWKPTIDKNFTLSEALEHSNRIGSTTILLILSAVFFAFLIEQGFVDKGSSRLEISVVASNFVLMLAMLILLIISPIKPMVKMGTHVLLTIIIMLFCIYNSYVISAIYDEVVESSITDVLRILSYVMIGLAGLIFLFYIGLKYSEYKSFGISKTSIFVKKSQSLQIGLTSFIAVTELIFITIFGASLGMFSTLPKLIHEPIVCVGIQKE